MKFFTSADKAIVYKDFGEIWNSKTTRTVLILLPLFTVLLLPAFFLILLINVPIGQMNGVEQMLKLIPVQAASFDERQSMFYILTNMICPMFFLMIPLISSSVSSACSFVGERERGTLETLFLTPFSARKIFKAKVLGCVLLSIVVSAISFVLFSIVMAVGDILLAMPFYLNWNWLVLFLFLSPAIIVFGVGFMIFVSAKSKSHLESVQTSGYLVLPIVLLYTGQFTGLFQVDAPLLLLLSVILFVADLLLLLFSSRSFTPEKLLR